MSVLNTRLEMIHRIVKTFRDDIWDVPTDMMVGDIKHAVDQLREINVCMMKITDTIREGVLAAQVKKNLPLDEVVRAQEVGSRLARGVTGDVAAHVLALCRVDGKVTAIKWIRNELMIKGLKEAKDLVEAMEAAGDI